MSEERLQEIKDSVNFQREILLAHNMRTLCVDEEQELIEEIKRLNTELELYKDNQIHLNNQLEQKDKIIDELEEYIHNELILDFYDEDMPCELIINKMEKMINKLKGSDKE